MYYYSNEIVFRGHPDKVCDQISDALVDEYLKQDKYSRCGIEVVGGKHTIFITGEVTSLGYVDVEKITKQVLLDIGYNNNFKIINNIGRQSRDIALGVDAGGAGDQGMMFGYACRDTSVYLPKAMVILQDFSRVYDELRKNSKNFLPDGKAQITGIYNTDRELIAIKDFTISYQNLELNRDETDDILKKIAIEICLKYGITHIENFHINPTGKFLIGGFDGDAGLTGRKIVVDNYQSFANVGGGAFSGKDCTKVDRSGAYKARQLAIRFLNENPNVNWCEVQLSYVIGLKKPLGIYITTNKGLIEEIPNSMFEECQPQQIISDLKLLEQSFYETAKFGHFGNPQFSWEF